MAHSHIVFKNPTFGTIKRAPVGFSWTTAIFGFWPALLRGDFKWAAIQFAATVGVGLFTIGIGMPIVWIVFAIIYNKLYIKYLISNGYLVDSIQSEFTLENLQSQIEVELLSKQLKPSGL